MRDTRPLFLARLLQLVRPSSRPTTQTYNTMVLVPGRAAVAMLGQMRPNWLLTIVFVAGTTLIFYPYAPPTAPGLQRRSRYVHRQAGVSASVEKAQLRTRCLHPHQVSLTQYLQGGDW